MLEKKERLKMEFDFLKSVFLVLLAFFGGIVATLFTKNLNFASILIAIVGSIGLSLIMLKLYRQITQIYKG